MPTPRSERTREILALLAAGDLSQQEIGDRYGISRQAVSQLGKNYKQPSTYEEKNRAHRAEMERRRARRILEESWARLNGEPQIFYFPPPRYTDDELLDLIRDFVAEHGRLPRSYPPELPVRAPTFMKRFGSWNKAIEAAGYEPESPRNPYRREFSDDDIIDAVCDFLDYAEKSSRDMNTPARSGEAAYRRWRRDVADVHAPAVSTIRHRMDWSTARSLAAARRRERKEA